MSFLSLRCSRTYLPSGTSSCVNFHDPGDVQLGVVGGFSQVAGCLLDLGSWVTVHELGPTSHSTMMLVLQAEGDSLIGMHKPKAHGGGVHADENHGVGFKSGPAIAHGPDLDVPHKVYLDVGERLALHDSLD